MPFIVRSFSLPGSSGTRRVGTAIIAVGNDPVAISFIRFASSKGVASTLRLLIAVYRASRDS